jgi:hypothetical protein
MAEKIVSPGVFTRENDLSFLQQGVAQIGTAFVGPFKEGPMVPTIVNTQSEFQQLFGIPDDTYYTPLAVQAYLKEAGAATICRVPGIGGYKDPGPLVLQYVFAPSGSDAVTSSLGILFNTDNNTPSFASGSSLVGNITSSGIFAISGSGFINGGALITASLNPADTNDITTVFGTDPRGTKEAYVYGFFSNKASTLTFNSTGSVYAVQLAEQKFEDDMIEARTPYIQSQLISGERYNLFQFETIGAGNAANTKVKVGITNIKRAGSVPGTEYGSFTVVVRAFSDTNKKKQVYETFSNVNLDPTSPNYIYRVIGDRYISIDENGKVTESGDWVNKSKYIRLVNFERTTTPNELAPEKIPTQAIPFAHDSYKFPLLVNSTVATTFPTVSYITTLTSTRYGGIDLDSNPDNTFYLSPIASGSSTGSNVPFSLDTSVGLTLVPETDDTATEVGKRNFLIAFQGGFDGMNPTTPIYKGKDIVAGNQQGFDCTTLTSSGSVGYLRQINALSNADEYDIQMIVTPGLQSNVHGLLVNEVLQMVEDRSDCFYIFEGVGYEGTIADARNQAKDFDTNYAASYYPWVKTIDINTNKLIPIPPSVLLPAVYAANDRVAAEWFAPAGLNRGGLNGAVAVLNKLTHADRDSLYEDKVNPIVQFPGQGIVVFGQKTLQNKPSALDRINVRRLLLTVRKYIASTSRYLIFEQNTAVTRNRFLNIANPYLEGIQQRQGLYAFKVVMDESNNTPDVIDRNFLRGAIYLQPTKTAEFIQIDFNILPTGATFGG